VTFQSPMSGWFPRPTGVDGAETHADGRCP
jgi:hypothetical protein